MAGPEDEAKATVETAGDDPGVGAGPRVETGAPGALAGEVSGEGEAIPASDPEGAEGYTITHRGGTRVEVGRAMRLPVASEPEHPWLCTVKLVGPTGPNDEESTQTLLLRSGRGRTADEAQKIALSRLSLVYGTPSDPPPPVVIRKLSSTPPPPDVERATTEEGFMGGIRAFWRNVGRFFRRA